MVPLFGSSCTRPSSIECESERGLDSRLEHVPDHRGQLAVEPLVEHLTCQLFRPANQVAHPAVELLFEDPLPSVVDKEVEILQEIDALNEVYAWLFPQFPKVRSWPIVVYGVGPVDVRLLWTNDQAGAVDRARVMAKQDR